MIRLLYTALLFIAAPFLLFSLYKKKPNKPAFGKRWKEHFGITPKLSDQSQTPIWIHTVSVGETIAATAFIKKLKQQYPETPIVLTTTTSTGAEQAKKLSEIAEHRYMPIDFPFAIKAFLKTIQPKHLIIMETELWPNTIHHVSRAGIPITVINARLSERSAQRYAKVPAIFNILSKGLNMLLCQHEEDAKRFQSLGIAAEKIKVTGSLKFDISIPPSTIETGNQLRSTLQSENKQRPIWIAASTHDGEDEILLQAHKQLQENHKNALLILVPRHPERFDNVYQLAIKQDMKTIRRSYNNVLTDDVDIYLGDTMGEMLTLIQAADVCFMGGSLLGDKVGGHNVLEPASLGKPIIMGDSYYNFKEITTTLINAGVITISNDSSSICHCLIDLFSDEKKRQLQSENAKRYVMLNQGAVQRTIEAIVFE